MKKGSGFLLMLMTLIGLTFCGKENPSPETPEIDKLPTSISVVFPKSFKPDSTFGSVTDIDGNIYKTIHIGSQTWMAENLKTTRYLNGSKIPDDVTDNEWKTCETGAYRWYNNDEATCKNKYGALYNWNAVRTGFLCPVGWHVPSDAEWMQMEMTLGMTKKQADSWADGFWSDADRGLGYGTWLKTTNGWNEWEGNPGNGTNYSGFAGLPGGDIESDGKSGGAGNWGIWWTSTDGLTRTLYSHYTGIYRCGYMGPCGFSVRCIKNN